MHERFHYSARMILKTFSDCRRLTTQLHIAAEIFPESFSVKWSIGLKIEQTSAPIVLTSYKLQPVLMHNSMKLLDPGVLNTFSNIDKLFRHGCDCSGLTFKTFKMYLNWNSFLVSMASTTRLWIRTQIWRSFQMLQNKF